MKKLRAIHISDLAKDPREGNLIFEYNKLTNRFHMGIKPTVNYDAESFLDDEECLFFLTELVKTNIDKVKNTREIPIGESTQITASEAAKYIASMKTI